MRTRIACGLIVKDCRDHLQKTLDSLIGAGFDELVIVDTGSTDGTRELAKSQATIFADYEDPAPIDLDGKKFLGDFAAARNFLNSIATAEYLFWIDSDDLLSRAIVLKGFLDAYFRTEEPDVDGAYLQYDYEHDENGRCTMRIPRERLFRRDRHVWRSPIHEVLCALSECRYRSLDHEQCHVIHDVYFTPELRLEKARRNLKVCEAQIARHGDSLELRFWYHYGRTLASVGRYHDALPHLERLAAESGWNEEAYHALLLAAEAMIETREYDRALDYAFRAMRRMPRLREAYTLSAQVYMLMEETESALHFADLADRAELANSGYQTNPMKVRLGTAKIRAHAYLRQHEFELAIKECDRILEVLPEDRDAMVFKVQCANLLRQEDLKRSFQKVEMAVVLEDSPEKLDALRQAIPHALRNEPGIRNPIIAPAGKRSIAFLCGESRETWGHDSHKRGIGGSETAVIHMARELAALGWYVEVYGTPSEEEEGTFEGVNWIPWWRYGQATQRDVFIGWRSPSFALHSNGKLTYLWLHDVQIPQRWREDMTAATNGVIVLSKAHRKTVDFIQEDKIFYSQNGLDPGFFREPRNEPHRAIYASSPERGLQYLLPMWHLVREAVPDAVLDIYYGFNRYFFEHMKISKKHRDTYEVFQQYHSQPGIRFHGMVGQGALAEAFAAAGVWFYPTDFEEISCITAMSAQANGAVPICPGYWALSETVRFGHVVGGAEDSCARKEVLERCFEELVKALKFPEAQEDIRRQMIPWARSEFLWSKVARDWHQRFQEDLQRLEQRSLIALKV